MRSPILMPSNRPIIDHLGRSLPIQPSPSCVMKATRYDRPLDYRGLRWRKKAPVFTSKRPMEMTMPG
jgi:hypothetical protein